MRTINKIGLFSCVFAFALDVRLHRTTWVLIDAILAAANLWFILHPTEQLDD